jgi:hypothetical protein
VGQGHFEVVKELINAGADINAKDLNGQTPLYLGLKTEHIEILNFFLAKAKLYLETVRDEEEYLRLKLLIEAALNNPPMINKISNTSSGNLYNTPTVDSIASNRTSSSLQENIPDIVNNQNTYFLKLENMQKMFQRENVEPPEISETLNKYHLELNFEETSLRSYQFNTLGDRQLVGLEYWKGKIIENPVFENFLIIGRGRGSIIFTVL